MITAIFPGFRSQPCPPQPPTLGSQFVIRRLKGPRGLPTLWPHPCHWSPSVCVVLVGQGPWAGTACIPHHPSPDPCSPLGNQSMPARGRDLEVVSVPHRDWLTRQFSYFPFIISDRGPVHEWGLASLPRCGPRIGVAVPLGAGPAGESGHRQFVGQPHPQSRWGSSMKGGADGDEGHTQFAGYSDLWLF